MKQPTCFQAGVGSRLPGGATWNVDGTNFAIYSHDAIGIELLLYKGAVSTEPFQVVVLDPKFNRTSYAWHVFVERLPVGIYYSWRVQQPDGTWWEVLDPWARAVSDTGWDRRQPISAANALRGIVTDTRFDWSEKTFVPKSLDGAVIYELHVGGYTKHHSSGTEHPGTFTGLIEKIPYLKELGITHVELLPVMAFDEQDVPNEVAALGLVNFWGYSPYGFYALHPDYCATSEPVREFQSLVDALHSDGIGIILDVDFNHTSESGAGGPAIHFKVLGNEIFYHFDGQHYRDYTGCGNTINCNHPLVTHFLVYCLEYWVTTMRVDGFRFDLASVFSRGEDGTVLKNPSLPWSIELSHNLSQTPIIAEAWDAAGLYQVGSFPGTRWSEWNGRYRDIIRRFVRGDRGLVGEVATCLGGSSDLYEQDHRLPTSSINFITCHDGFTLWDLVSYNQKHNLTNGESNRDGADQNFSWNCGAEGDTAEPNILALRHQQSRNFLAFLFLSRGVPMLLAGDEFLRTQHGNNNAWCQNNEVSWLDWRLAETHREMIRFVRELIAFRLRHPSLTCPRFFTGDSAPHGIPDISWHGLQLNEPLWGQAETQVLACTIAGVVESEGDLHIVLNMSADSIGVKLPNIPLKRWYLAIDTSAHAPDDIIEEVRQRATTNNFQRIDARSVVVFEGRANAK
ncbi:glycogen debranching protein [Methylomonas sp. MS20]|uniref:glycogen debranching protein n=1 Tax=Methylomonas sp. MS20 TaxID=3418769 RepID=UPI003D087BB5